MQDARAISAQLVDIRNVGTQKVVKLTIHAPQEQAMQIMKLFGWPTGVDPVPVALARLNEEPKGGDVHANSTAQHVDTPPAPQTARAGRASVAPEKKLAQRAAILCGDPVFQRFIEESEHTGCRNEDDAADAVRFLCGIESRSEIRPGTPAAIRWDKLYSRFIAWRDVEVA